MIFEIGARGVDTQIGNRKVPTTTPHKDPATDWSSCLILNSPWGDRNSDIAGMVHRVSLCGFFKVKLCSYCVGKLGTFFVQQGDNGAFFVRSQLPVLLPR